MKWMPHAQPIKLTDGIGLVVIMAGLIIYLFTAVIQSLWAHYTGSLSKEDLAREKLANVIDMKTQKQQTRLVGFNQMEALNTIIDTRISKAQTTVAPRSPQQIRNSLLVKLGIPPSPSLTTGPRSRGLSQSPNLTGHGPVLGERRISESWDKIKKRSSLEGVYQYDGKPISANSSFNSRNAKPFGAPLSGILPSNPNSCADGDGIALSNISPIRPSFLLTVV